MGESEQSGRETIQRKITKTWQLWKLRIGELTVVFWRLLSAPFRADALYRARHTLWPWLWILSISLALIGMVLALIDFAIQSDRFGETSTLWTGVWTLVLALGAAPFAWYTWLIRDRNKHEDQRQQASISAREHFNKLREFSTQDGQLWQVATLFDLQAYLSDVGIQTKVPSVISDEQPGYRQQVRLFFLELLRTRREWDKEVYQRLADIESLEEESGSTVYRGEEGEWEDLTEVPIPFNRARHALEACLIRYGHKIGAYKNIDFSYLNLENACFTGAYFQNCSFRYRELSGANFTEARFIHSHWEASQIQRAKFYSCKFQNCFFIGGVLDGCVFSEAAFTNVSFRGVRIVDCDFSTSSRRGTSFQGSQTNRGTKWPPNFDLELAGIEIVD